MLLRNGPQIRALKIIQISIYQTLILYIQKKTGKIGGGGILINSKNDIKFNIVKDLSASDGNN